MLVQVVQNNLRHGIALEHNHQTLTGTARRFITHVRDARNLAVLDVASDLRGQRVRVDLVGQFGDNQAGAALDFLDFNNRALRNRTAAGAVGVFNALAAQNRGPTREVGALDDAQQRLESLLVGSIRVAQQPLRTSCDFAQVVRRNVGGHTDGNTGRTVDQQVRETRRQVDGFLVAAVVVVLEVDGLLFDVPDHFQGQRRHLAFRVTRSSRAVITGRTEVALTRNERVTHIPRLHQTHERVIDGRVTVRVEVAHDVADHARALREAAIGAVSAVVHGVQHTPVNRLEAVANIRQSTADNDRHRVVQVGPLHFGIEVDLVDASGNLGASAVNRGLFFRVYVVVVFFGHLTGSSVDRNLSGSVSELRCLKPSCPAAHPGIRCPRSGRPWRFPG